MLGTPALGMAVVEFGLRPGYLSLLTLLIASAFGSVVFIGLLCGKKGSKKKKGKKDEASESSKPKDVKTAVPAPTQQSVVEPSVKMVTQKSVTKAPPPPAPTKSQVTKSKVGKSTVSRTEVAHQQPSLALGDEPPPMTDKSQFGGGKGGGENSQSEGLGGLGQLRVTSTRGEPSLVLFSEKK